MYTWIVTQILLANFINTFLSIVLFLLEILSFV